MHRDGPRPNLFIIGAAKSGTTSLHHYLNSHPDVFMCEPKEPGFFVAEHEFYSRDEGWYRSLFASAGDARIVGESSTHYAKLPLYKGVPERIAGYSPDARFIYLMRDPIERVVSHYWQRVKQYCEHRPIIEAVRHNVEYTAYSDYRMQLDPYFSLFGRERVLLLTFEELARDPRRTLETVFTWLGVDETLGTTEFPKENARPPVVQRIRGKGWLHRFARSGAWDRVAPLVPKALRSAGGRLTVETVRPGDESAIALVEMLRPEQAAQARALEAYLGQQFLEWTTVFPERAVTSPPAAVA